MYHFLKLFYACFLSCRDILVLTCYPIRIKQRFLLRAVSHSLLLLLGLFWYDIHSFLFCVRRRFLRGLLKLLILYFLNNFWRRLLILISSGKFTVSYFFEVLHLSFDFLDFFFLENFHSGFFQSFES